MSIPGYIDVPERRRLQRFLDLGVHAVRRVSRQLGRACGVHRGTHRAETRRTTPLAQPQRPASAEAEGGVRRRGERRGQG